METQLPTVSTKTEMPAVKKPKQAMYRNDSKGRFAVYGITWEVDQELPVRKEIENDKKFKHAVKLGCLIKV